MKTFKTLVLAGAGLLLAGAANAQVAAPVLTPSGLQATSVTTNRDPNNAINAGNTSRGGRFYYETSYVQQLGEGQYASVLQAGLGNMTADIEQTSAATRSDAYQEQSSINNGFGTGDHAYIFQNGARGISSQRQAGNDNTAVARQLDGAENVSFQHQIGNSNEATLSQSGANNFAHQYQEGNSNLARTTQVNSQNWSTTEQRGNSNTALVSQR